MKDRKLAELVRDQQPLIMPPETTVPAACAAMHARRVGAVLVAGADRKLAGIFTGRDALRCLATEADPSHLTLAQAMTRNPHQISAQHTAMDALRMLDNVGVRHMPIVEHGRVVGIVSRYDFRGMEHHRLDEETGFFETIR